jgi:hypothetical protein
MSKPVEPAQPLTAEAQRRERKDTSTMLLGCLMTIGIPIVCVAGILAVVYGIVRFVKWAWAQ